MYDDWIPAATGAANSLRRELEEGLRGCRASGKNVDRLTGEEIISPNILPRVYVPGSGYGSGGGSGPGGLQP